MTADQTLNINWIITQGISYQQYYQSIVKMVDDNTTSGAEITQERIELTKLNMHRMKRINEASYHIEPMELSSKIAVAILTEAWCGDSAQNVPWLEHFLNACNPKVESYYFFRDEHPDLMNQFLTNGSRSIPKCIFFDESTGNVLGTWGPRPTEIKNWLADFRAANPEISKHDWEIELHKYYTKNKGAAILSDLKELISNFS
jgi:thioredoxin-like negative regulator of GroEL